MDDQNFQNAGPGGADADPFHYTPDAAPQNMTPNAPQNTPYTGGYSSQPTGFTPPPFGTLPDVPQDYPTGMATASLVLGIISLVLGLFIAILPIPLMALPIIGIILGAVYKSKHYPVAKGISTAGIVLSVITIVIAILIIIVSFAMLDWALEYIYQTDPALYDEYFGNTYGYNF
jgi:thiol:disulfide interchange protein